MKWQREDILEVLAWVEDAADDVNAITTELEYIVISELLKRCADEIRSLRNQVADLEKTNARRKKTK